MTRTTLVYWACSAVAAVALLFKIHDLRDAPCNRMRWAVCSTLLLAGAAVFCAAPATIAFVNRASGVPNLAAPLVYSMLLALSASSLVLIAYWRDPPGAARRTARRWLLAYALLIGCLNVLFLLGDAPVERRRDFDTHYATTPYIAEFIVLYLLALTGAMIGLIRTGRHWARVAGRPWLRRGLRLIMSGSAGALAFSVTKLAAVVARWTGTDWDRLSTEVAPGFAVLGLLLSAAGYALPAWGVHLTRARGRCARYRAYRDLYPLWDALRRATPAIVPPARVPWWDLELRLTRRLAEINDGSLALRSYTDPLASAAARRLAEEAGLMGTDLQAVVDASRLKAAVAAKSCGRRFPVDAGPDSGRPLGGADGAGELAWLTKVSRAYHRSPVVAAAVTAAPRHVRPTAEHG